MRVCKFCGEHRELLNYLGGLVGLWTREYTFIYYKWCVQAIFLCKNLPFLETKKINEGPSIFIFLFLEPLLSDKAQRLELRMRSRQMMSDIRCWHYYKKTPGFANPQLAINRFLDDMNEEDEHFKDNHFICFEQ